MIKVITIPLLHDLTIVHLVSYVATYGTHCAGCENIIATCISFMSNNKTLQGMREGGGVRYVLPRQCFSVPEGCTSSIYLLQMIGSQVVRQEINFILYYIELAALLHLYVSSLLGNCVSAPHCTAPAMWLQLRQTWLFWRQDYKLEFSLSYPVCQFIVILNRPEFILLYI